MYRMSQCRPNSKLSAFECFPEHSAKALLGLCQCSTWHLACPSLMRGQSKLDRREAPGAPAGKMQNGQTSNNSHHFTPLNTTASTVLPDLKQTLDVLHCYTMLYDVTRCYTSFKAFITLLAPIAHSSWDSWAHLKSTSRRKSK